MPTNVATKVSAFGVAAAIALIGLQDQPPSAETIALGKKIFEGKAGGAICFTCHGPDAKGVKGLGPSLADTIWLHGDGSIAFIEKIVKDGVPKAKESAVAMLPMGGARLNAGQVQAVAAYIHSLSRRP